MNVPPAPSWLYHYFILPSDEYKSAREAAELMGVSRQTAYRYLDQMLRYIRSGFKFNAPSIKRLYYVLTKDLVMQNGMPYPRGFKNAPNVVNNMETTTPDQVETELSELLEYYKENKKREHPLKLAFHFHLRYEGIHPFVDGNGRTGRMIMNKILMTNGYFPVVIYSKNSTAYYNAIAKGLTSRNKRGYYQFMLKQSLKTYKAFLKFVKKY